MLELVFFFAAFSLTNWFARRFGRLSPIWGLHAFVLAFLIGSLCMFVLKVVLAAMQGLPYDAPLWRFDTSLWVLLLPSAVGSVVSFLLMGAIIWLLSRRYEARLVRWAGHPVWPERYWVHICMALIYTVGWFLTLPEKGNPNPYISLAILGTWGVMGKLGLLERRRKAAVSKKKDDPRPPVLLLRSFGLARKNPDLRTGEEGISSNKLFMGKRSFEERLASAIDANVGPLRALGDPSDFLPELGAARLYASEATWQDTVADEVSKAQCLLVMEGSSRGLRWEWEFIQKNIPPQKIFLMTYPKKFPARSEWSTTIGMLKEIGIKIPSEDPGGMSLYRFTDQWEGKLLIAGSKTEDEIAEILYDQMPGDSDPQP
jgi:hypothetical protein